MKSGFSSRMKSDSARRASDMEALKAGLVETRMNPISVIGHKTITLSARQAEAAAWWTWEGQIKAMKCIHVQQVLHENTSRTAATSPFVIGLAVTMQTGNRE